MELNELKNVLHYANHFLKDSDQSLQPGQVIYKEIILFISKSCKIRIIYFQHFVLYTFSGTSCIHEIQLHCWSG